MPNGFARSCRTGRTGSSRTAAYRRDGSLPVVDRTLPAGRSRGDPIEENSARLALEVLAQPDDLTCGPTCLHAVYRYWGRDIPLKEVIEQIPPLPEGGTLAVDLGCHALRQGFNAEIYTCNLQVFDPTWFGEGVDIGERLQLQRRSKRDQKLSVATDAYLDFMELGGRVRFEELTGSLLRKQLNQGIPVLTGLSATYLYNCARETGRGYDDVRGVPTGHFVVLSGYDREHRKVMIADPLHENPSYDSHYYSVDMSRLIASILLGVITYDANILIITPRDRS